MGVTGLLQQLKPIQQSTSLSQYKGQTLAVDTYGWLHRGLISCAQDLCMDVPTRGYITSVMKKVDMLLHFGVTPLMVFDGSPLPTKEGTHVERRLKREKAREQAQLLAKRGDRKAAWKEYMKAAAVTPEMAKSVMVELDRRHVAYVVAPYEADPQMVYLEKTGAVAGILSEDLDLLVFGCRRLITKLNDYGGCVEVCRDNLHKVPRMLLHTYTPAQWRLVAILSGCDYTKGVPGVGLKTAFSLVLKIQDLDRIVLALRADNKTIPDEFLDEATKADLAFQYQKVFDPATRTLITLCEITPDLGLDMPMLELCCGRRLDPHIHAGICTGKLHPSTHKPLLSREHNLQVARSHSVNSNHSVSRHTGGPRSQERASNTEGKAVTNLKGIDGFFKSEKAAMKAPANSSTNLGVSLKRPSSLLAQLSPNSKKLRRFQTGPGPTAHGAMQSKFFSSSPALLPLVSALLAYTNTDADLGFVAGDSEVPESSSPARIENSVSDECDTDDDGDTGFETAASNSMASTAECTQLRCSLPTKVESDADEGYANEIDESPVRTEVLSLLWRERFALGGTEKKGASFEHKTLICVQANQAGEPKREVHGGMALPQLSPTKIEEDSPSSSLMPQTPEHVLEKRMLADGSSQIKSLQRTFISELDDELELSPVRKKLVLPQKQPALRLLRFAFTGR